MTEIPPADCAHANAIVNDRGMKCRDCGAENYSSWPDGQGTNVWTPGDPPADLADLVAGKGTLGEPVEGQVADEPTSDQIAATAATLASVWKMDKLAVYMQTLTLDQLYRLFDDLNNASLFGVMAELRRRKENGEPFRPEDSRIVTRLAEVSADRDRLAAENERLRAALQRIAATDGVVLTLRPVGVLVGIARDALTGPGN